MEGVNTQYPSMETAGMTYSKGPLSLEMGAVTSAVDDLVSGYESLVATLPEVAQRVNDIQSGTECMAHRLEDRMRYLIDGYEYLDSVSSQIPPALQKMAAAHKKNILDASELLGSIDKEDLNRYETNLQKLKGDLKSMAYERVVMDVLTRDSIKEGRANGKRSHHQGSSRARNIAGYTTHRGKDANEPSSGKGKVGSEHDVNAPIPIGRFHSILKTPERNPATDIRLGKQPTQSPDKQPSQHIYDKKSSHYRYDVFSVQSSAGAVVVPSVRTGNLPPELRHIKTTPTAHKTVANRKRKIPKSQYPAKKKGVPASKVRSVSPKRDLPVVTDTTKAAVSGLQRNMETSVRQIEDMKARLNNAEIKRKEDQECTEQKLDSIKQLIIEKEHENAMILGQLKRKSAAISRRKKVIVETVDESASGHVQYKVLPVKRHSANVVANDTSTAATDIAYLNESSHHDCGEVAIAQPGATSVTHAKCIARQGNAALPKEDENVPGVATDMIVLQGDGFTLSDTPIARTEPPAIVISEPESGENIYVSSSCAQPGGVLPNLQERSNLFDSSSLTHHNRPLQSWTSRVKFGPGNEDLDHFKSEGIEKPETGDIGKTESNVQFKETDIMPPGEARIETTGQGWMNAHYPEHVRPNVVQDDLMELVKGMVLHQQSTIESQAELMRTILNATETRGELPPEVSGLMEPSEQELDVMDGAEPLKEPDSQIRNVNVIEKEPVRTYNTSFGRLLALGPAFGSTTHTAPTEEMLCDSDAVLQTIYPSAEKASHRHSFKAEPWHETTKEGWDYKKLSNDDLHQVNDPKGNMHARTDTHRSSRVAALSTVKELKQNVTMSTNGSSVPENDGSHFVNEVIGALRDIIRTPTNTSSGVSGALIQQCQCSNNDSPSSTKKSRMGKSENELCKPDDPRSLERHMIEECVERAVRAVMPPHLLNAQRLVGHGSEAKGRVRLSGNLSSVENNICDNDAEWTSHDARYNKDSETIRPTGGFENRIRKDLSGIYEEEPGSKDSQLDPVDNEDKRRKKVVAGPGGLVYYGKRDGWDEDRCYQENEYHSFRASKIPYQRYINRNGMNHSTLTETGIEEHFIGSDEDINISSEVAKGGRQRVRYEDAAVEVANHLNGGADKKSTGGDSQETGGRKHCDERNVNDIQAIIDRDISELADYRREQEDEQLDETKSSISEYSDGSHPDLMLPNRERHLRVPPEAIALEYERRARENFGFLPQAAYGPSVSSRNKYIASSDHPSHHHNRNVSRPHREQLFSVPTPLVSTHLNHTATAEAAALGPSFAAWEESRQYTSMDTDSDAEANVQYPLPIASNIASSRGRVYTSRDRVTPRSRFLHNMQPLSDASSEIESEIAQFKPKDIFSGDRLRNGNIDRYLGNKRALDTAVDLLSECSSGTPESSVSLPQATSVGRRTSKHSKPPRRKNSSEESNCLCSDDESKAEISTSDAKETKNMNNTSSHRSLRPNVFSSMLRLKTEMGEVNGSTVSPRSFVSDSDDTGASVVLPVGCSDHDDEMSYYSSMDSSLTLSSTSQSVEMHSVMRWGNRRK